MPRRNKSAKQSIVRPMRKAPKGAKRRVVRNLAPSSSRISVNYLPTTQSPTPLASSYKFGTAVSGKGATGLKVLGTQPLIQIGKAGTTPTVDVSAMYTRGGTIMLVAPVNPFESAWIGGVLEMIATPFTRFRFRRLCFHYRPFVISTAQLLGLSFAFSNDPQQPLLATGASPTTTAILDAGGFSFAAWQPWDYECQLEETDQLYFTSEPGTPTVSDIRQCNQGLVACSFANTNGDAATKVGQIWVSFDLELFDPQPVATTASVALPDIEECVAEEKAIETPRGGLSVKRGRPKIVVDDYVADFSESGAQSVRSSDLRTDRLDLSRPLLKRQ